MWVCDWVRVRVWEGLSSVISFVLMIGFEEKKKKKKTQQNTSLCSSVKFSNDLTCARPHVQVRIWHSHVTPCLVTPISGQHLRKYKERHIKETAVTAYMEIHSDRYAHRQARRDSATNQPPIAFLLMEILPSRCALLEEHMECETDLFTHTGSEPAVADTIGCCRCIKNMVKGDEDAE